jgi:hypothetical protein
MEYTTTLNRYPCHQMIALNQGVLALYSPMPTIRLSVPHNLGATEAKTRISRLFTELRTQLGSSITDVEESWTDNRGLFRFRMMSIPISGRLQVEPAEVHVEVDLPFAALPFKSRVENEISTRARALLSG